MKKKNYTYTPRPSDECKYPPEVRAYWAKRKRDRYWRLKKKEAKKK